MFFSVDIVYELSQYQDYVALFIFNRRVNGISMNGFILAALAVNLLVPMQIKCHVAILIRLPNVPYLTLLITIIKNPRGGEIYCHYTAQHSGCLIGEL